MESSFSPPRRAGLILHVVLIMLCLLGSAWNLQQATRSPLGQTFSGFMLGFIGLTLPVPLLVYRLYGLLRSSYSIRPGKLRLTWGLRVEEIPIVDITWVRPESELDARLPLPFLRWPGAVIGLRRLDRHSRVEFMASRRSGLILIETARRAYAISPEDPAAFLLSFRRVAELGSLDTITGRSFHPGELVGSAWESRPARAILAVSFLLALGFAAWMLSGLNAQPGQRFALGDTGRFVNNTQLFLLPVLNSLYFFFDLLLGLFFFRRAETRPLAYLLWVGSTLVSLLFFVAAIGLLSG